MSRPSPPPLIEIRNGQKGWSAGKRKLEILKDIHLEIYPGESIAIMGPSGAGKSTLLHILGFLTPLDGGGIFFNGRQVNGQVKPDLGHIRPQIGMIFQDSKLIPNLRIVDNVCLPLAHRGVWPGRQHRLAIEQLEKVGLGHRLDHHPNQLSGGEQSRAAIARALILQPKVLLADEPTGNLDSHTGDHIAGLLLSTVTPQRALVLITHNELLAQKADRILYMKDGQLHGSHP